MSLLQLCLFVPLLLLFDLISEFHFYLLTCIIADLMVCWLSQLHMLGTQIHPGSVDALSFIQTMISVLLGSQDYAERGSDAL